MDYLKYNRLRNKYIHKVVGKYRLSLWYWATDFVHTCAVNIAKRKVSWNVVKPGKELKSSIFLLNFVMYDFDFCHQDSQ